MSLPPQKFREIVLQILYSQNMSESDSTAIISLLMTQLEVSKKNVFRAYEKAQEIISHSTDIKKLISSFSTSYEFDRIHKITQNILLLTAYELLFQEDIPPKVVIAEAIRLSRKFNTPESAAFANAILDQIYRKKMGLAIDSTLISDEGKKWIENEEATLAIIKEELIEKPKEEKEVVDAGEN